MDYYSAIKKEWNNAMCSNMDGPRDYHTKRSKSERDKYAITDMWNLRYETKTGLQTSRTHLWLPRGRRDEGEKDREFGVCRDCYASGG